MSGTEQEGCRFSSVLIVDDHPLFCDALAMTLRAVAQIGKITSAARLDRALALLAESPGPDVVVLDLNLPDVDGLDGLVRLMAATRAPVIVISSMTDSRLVAQVIGAGAAGYVPKHSQREVFRAAFEALRRGERFLPDGHSLQDDGIASETAETLRRLATLTTQQNRILQLICEGKLNKQIAYDLSIAETTVKAHVTAIMRKLGVQSRTQAVLLAKQLSFASVLHAEGQSA